MLDFIFQSILSSIIQAELLPSREIVLTEYFNIGATGTQELSLYYRGKDLKEAHDIAKKLHAERKTDSAIIEKEFWPSHINNYSSWISRTSKCVDKFNNTEENRIEEIKDFGLKA